jgi:hypothetical protein
MARALLSVRGRLGGSLLSGFLFFLFAALTQPAHPQRQAQICQGIGVESGAVLAPHGDRDVDSALVATLRWLVPRSAIIFSGEVLPVQAASDRGPTDPHERHDLHLRVDQGIRGVRAGEIFLLRRWPGADVATLSLHERVIVFLHQPNAAGFTSSAVGMLGPLRIGGGSRVDLQSLTLLSQELSSRTDLASDPLPGQTPCPASVLQQHVGRPCDLSVFPPRHAAVGTMPVQQLVELLRTIATGEPVESGRFKVEAADAP